MKIGVNPVEVKRIRYKIIVDFHKIAIFTFTTELRNPWLVLPNSQNTAQNLLAIIVTRLLIVWYCRSILHSQTNWSYLTKNVQDYMFCKAMKTANPLLWITSKWIYTRLDARYQHRWVETNMITISPLEKNYHPDTLLTAHHSATSLPPPGVPHGKTNTYTWSSTPSPTALPAARLFPQSSLRVPLRPAQSSPLFEALGTSMSLLSAGLRSTLKALQIHH